MGFQSFPFPFLPYFSCDTASFPPSFSDPGCRGSCEGDPKAREEGDPRALHPPLSASQMWLWWLVPWLVSSTGFHFLFCLVRALFSQTSSKSPLQNLCPRFFFLKCSPEARWEKWKEGSFLHVNFSVAKPALVWCPFWVAPRSDCITATPAPQTCLDSPLRENRKQACPHHC